jgi:hypothetical protein
MKERVASQVTSVQYGLMLAGLVAMGLTGSMGTSPAPTSDTLAQRQHSGKVVEAQPRPVLVAIATSPAAAAVSPFKFKVDRYYEQLSDKMRWLPVRYAGSVLKTPDPQSRILLAQSAAQRAGLEQVGLSYRDVYGIINAETSWIPRMGSSKDGTPNLGIAQFEPATAKGLGLRNPNDPVESIHVAALHMKEAAEWSAKRLSGLKLGASDRAMKLREGVSIFYNLSVKGRNRWNGKNTAKLPIETQLHIRNARNGALFAAELDARQPAASMLVAGR